MPPRKTRQILGLDLLRAAAATLVMLFHYTFWYWVDDPYRQSAWPASFRPLAPLSSVGWVGVEIFFVISGFVITYSSENISPATFVRHRITRLLPAALLCATLTALVTYKKHSLLITLFLWLHSVTFWPRSPWIDGSYWTLPIEVAFYGLVFLCLLLNRRWLPIAMAALGTVSTLWNTVLHPAHQPNNAFLLLHGCFFALGVFLYGSLHRGFTLFRCVALALCLPGCLAFVYSGRLWAEAIWIGGVAFLILSVRCNARAHTLAGPRGTALIRKIGLTTYPFYLLHDAVGTLLLESLQSRFGLSPNVSLVCTCVAMITAAALITQYAEPWVRRGITQLITPQPTAEPVFKA